MSNGSAGEPERMVITREFDAPREVVWKAWTDPQYAMQWWGPKDFTTPVCRMDFRVGGRYLFCMRSPAGQEFWTGGEYLEIVPHEKIVLTMYPTDEKGNKADLADFGVKHEAIEGAHDVVLFEDLGSGRTKLTLLGNETMSNAKESGQLEGWNQILDKFAGAVAGLAQAS
jgi:uncharacterized protein YndB with AHSA1/START domain